MSDETKKLGLFSRVVSILSGSGKETFSKVAEELAKEMDDVNEKINQCASVEEMKKLSEKLDKQIAEFKALREVLDNEEKPDKYKRSLATGEYSTQYRTDF